METDPINPWHSPGLSDGFISKHMAKFGPIRVKPRMFTPWLLSFSLSSRSSFPFPPYSSLWWSMWPCSQQCHNHEVSQTWDEADVLEGRARREKRSLWWHSWVTELNPEACPSSGLWEALYIFCWRWSNEMVDVVLFVTARHWKQPKCSFTQKRIK